MVCALYVDALCERTDLSPAQAREGPAWCHLVADTHAELIHAATVLSLPGKRIDQPGQAGEHLDLCARERDQAVRLCAARPITTAALATLLHTRAARRHRRHAKKDEGERFGVEGEGTTWRVVDHAIAGRSLPSHYPTKEAAERFAAVQNTAATAREVNVVLSHQVAQGERWPRLSRDLPFTRSPEVCQACGFVDDPERDTPIVRGYREHDDHDVPEDILVLLCPPCSSRLIDPHPRFYAPLAVHQPWPGAMALCTLCRHRCGVDCLHPGSRRNGGPGLSLSIAPPLHVDMMRGGRRVGSTIYPHPAHHCTGRELLGEGDLAVLLHSQESHV